MKRVLVIICLIVVLLASISGCGNAGMVGGAAVGFAALGPPGAIFGGLIGAMGDYGEQQRLEQEEQSASRSQQED